MNIHNLEKRLKIQFDTKRLYIPSTTCETKKLDFYKANKAADRHLDLFCH